MTTYLAGVGMTPFGKIRDSTLATLGRAAGRQALTDAGIEPQHIEMIACGSARSGILHARESGVGQLIGWDLGIEGVAVYNEKAFCASGAVAFNIAHMALTAGVHDVALVVGVEKMSSRDGAGRPLTSDGMVLEGEQGFTPPAYYAMAARRHMATYGTTREQIATVAVKNRSAAQHNPKAQYRDPITLDDVLGSKEVVSPLNLLDCCPTGDGAAAAVLVNEAGAEKLGLQPSIRVAASVIGSGYYRQQDRDMTSFSLDKSTSRRA
jgi:acetyl-CoA acetyltransferase